MGGVRGGWRGVGSILDSLMRDLSAGFGCGDDAPTPLQTDSLNCLPLTGQGAYFVPVSPFTLPIIL